MNAVGMNLFVCWQTKLDIELTKISLVKVGEAVGLVIIFKIVNFYKPWLTFEDWFILFCYGHVSNFKIQIPQKNALEIGDTNWVVVEETHAVPDCKNVDSCTMQPMFHLESSKKDNPQRDELFQNAGVAHSPRLHIHECGSLVDVESFASDTTA
jgi:hypothetical protein